MLASPIYEKEHDKVFIKVNSNLIKSPIKYSIDIRLKIFRNYPKMHRGDFIEQAEEPLDSFIPYDFELELMEYFGIFTKIDESNS